MPSAAERRALEAACDAICGDSAAADVVLELSRLSRQERELRFVLGLLAVRRFAALPRARRERLLVRWRDSRIPQLRAGYQALKKGALLGHYAAPEHWPELGYPGPLGREPRERSLRPTEARGRLDCDVCVVGSGAGGGVAAAVLAQAGLDVVVLEAGGYDDDGDFDGAELDAYERLYWRGASATTVDGGIGLLAGQCLGGTTTINYTTSFRTPDALREEWGGPFPGSEFTRSLDAVCERLGVNTDHNRPSQREELMARGLRELGWHIGAMPRNVRGCDQGRVCGYCGFGCRLGAKQSTLKTWLADAAAAGARLVVGTKARRVLVERGHAVGVEADGLAVRSRAVVAAGGSFETPALLRRSGLDNVNIGRHLHLHPTTAVLALFDEDVRPWEGTMQALYSDQHADLDGGYGLKYETAAIHPGLFTTFAPWPALRDLAGELPRSTGIGVLLRDRGSGEVVVGRDGEPQVRYRLSDYDAAHVLVGLEGAARILEAAGARLILSSHARGLSYAPARGARERWHAACTAEGFAPGRCVFFAFHLMGSARVGGSPAETACTWEGETWEVPGLYVMDASSFRSASGVNPMVTVEAIAHLNASKLAARLA
jgi:choline dehydrogenase-like flavoprotein